MVDFQQLQRNLRLSKMELEAPLSLWKHTNKSISLGVDQKKSKKSRIKESYETRDQYLSVRRYCDDTSDLMDFHESLSFENNLCPTTEVFAIDAHIFAAYADYREKQDAGKDNHKGFKFFSNEDYIDQEPELKDRYRLLCYQSVLYDTKVTLLDASRTELTHHLSYFMEQAMQRRDASEPENPVLKILNEIEDAWKDSKKTQAAGWLGDAFERLVGLAGSPLTQRRIAFARLIEVMRAGVFPQPEQVVRKEIDELTKEYPEATNLVDVDDKLKSFGRLLKHIRSNPAFVAGSRKDLNDAYEQYILATKFEEETPSPRSGVFDDLNAVHEIHVLNWCLVTCSLPIRIRYVTLSPRIYNFVRVFNRHKLLVPLVHPRNAFLYRYGTLFENHRDEFQNVSSSTIASQRAIAEDGKVLFQEISDFQDKFRNIVESVQKTFLHAVADTDAERELMIRSLKTLFDTCDALDEDDRFRADRLVSSLTEKLEVQVRDVENLFEERSSQLSEDGWKAYRELREPSEHHDTKVAIRKYDPGNGADKRLACLPLNGSYRHIFVLHHSRITKRFDKYLNENSQGVIGISEILRIVEESALKGNRKGNELQQRVDRGLMYFMRACSAACARDWPLANSLVSQAHKAVGVRGKSSEDEEGIDEFFGFPLKDLTDPTKELENRVRVNAVLLDQEILHLSHMSRRAIAETHGATSRSETWLRRARMDLSKSAKLTITVPKELVEFSSPFNPVSVRQTLAAIELTIEWLVRRAEHKRASEYGTKGSPLSGILPDVKEYGAKDTIAWHDIDSLWTDVPGSYSPNTLLEVIDQVIEKLESSVREIKSNEEVPGKESMGSFQSRHSEFLWNHKLLRAYLMKMLVFTCIDCGLIDRDDQTPNVMYLTQKTRSRVETLRKEAKKLATHHERLQKEKRNRTTRNNARLNVDLEDEYHSKKLPDDGLLHFFRKRDNIFIRALLICDNMRANEAKAEEQSDFDGLLDYPVFVHDFGLLSHYCNRLYPYGFERKVLRKAKQRFAPTLIENSKRLLSYEDVVE